jgi:hypothetical protein
MVVPLAAAAIALLGLIAVVSGVVLVSAYRRDIATAASEEVISTNVDSTVQQILNNGDLSSEDKAAALKEYLNTVGSSSGTGEEDLKKYALLGFVGLGALMILGRK